MKPIKIKSVLLLFTLILTNLLTFINPSIQAFAGRNDTIIGLSPNRDYEIGEKVTVTVGISSPDGSYLKSADCGFGYNGSTMKLLTELDSPDHFTIESKKPQKWLYYDLEFEMIADGKMYFIAGAYEGNGVIKAILANGKRKNLERASVVRTIGTGIYTNVSDCNLDSFVLKNENGKELTLNRPFNKNETEYYVSNQEFKTITMEATTENPKDKIIYPDMTLIPGENVKKVLVEAENGAQKAYIFHIMNPVDKLSVKNIQLVDQDNNPIEFNFNVETLEYIIEVPESVNKIKVNGTTGNNGTEFSYPSSIDIDYGYNNFDVIAKTSAEEAIYKFNVFRQTKPLRLTNLYGELSDGNLLVLDQEFNPDIFEYTGKCTSDIQKVKFHYNLGNDDIRLLNEPVFELNEGVNLCDITITDKSELEQKYRITIIKEAYDQTEKKKDEFKPYVNNRLIDHFNFNELKFLPILSVIIIIGIIIILIYQISKRIKDYQSSDEKKFRKEEKEHQERLNEINKKNKNLKKHIE